MIEVEIAKNYPEFKKYYIKGKNTNDIENYLYRKQSEGLIDTYLISVLRGEEK